MTRTTHPTHAEVCSNGRTRRNIVHPAGSVSLPRGRRVLAMFDDLAGGAVVVTEAPSVAAPTLALVTSGDGGETTRALLCRAMAAEIGDAVDRFLADRVPDQHACDVSRDDTGTLRLQLAVTLRAVADHDQAYAQRYPLVWRALAQATALGWDAGVAVDPANPANPVVYLELPRYGQVSWHMPAHRIRWDGHTTSEKYDRVDRFVTAVTADAAPELLAT